MYDYKLLLAFVTVARELSFDKGAQALNLTQSAVSQRIKQLEGQIGQPLLVRSNPLRLTAAGHRVMQHFERVKLMEDQLDSDLNMSHEQRRTRIAIAVNADSLATWLLPALRQAFDDQQVIFEFHTDDQDQTLEFMRQGSAHACISSEAKTIQGAKCIFLGYMPYYLVASPTLVAQYFRDGVTAESLKRAPSVVYGRNDELTNSYLEEHFQLSDQDVDCHTLPSADGFLKMALAGAAYALLPQLQALKHIQRGSLVNLTPDKVIDVPLFWHHWQLQNDKLQALTDIVTSSAERVLAEKISC